VNAILILAIALSAGCASISDSTAAEPLVGRWRYADSAQICEYEFLKDGKFVGYVSARGKMLSQFSGSWSLGGGAIHYLYTFDLLGRIPPGTRDQDRLVALKKTYFVIEAGDGSRRKYLRTG
jgi:hypothetical protein